MEPLRHAIVGPVAARALGREAHVAVSQDLGAFCRAEEARALAVAFTLLRNKEDAEDVVQEALFALTRYWEKLSASGSPQAWFYRVVCNNALSVRRRRAVWGRRRHLIETDRSAIDPTTPELLAEHAEVLAAVDTLPDRERKVTALWMNRSTEREIAQILGISVGTVNRLRQKANVKLARMLGESLEDDE